MEIAEMNYAGTIGVKFLRWQRPRSAGAFEKFFARRSCFLSPQPSRFSPPHFSSPIKAFGGISFFGMTSQKNANTTPNLQKKRVNSRNASISSKKRTLPQSSA